MQQVRNGQQVVPVCNECGCRLRAVNGPFLLHYQTEQMGRGRDAKGCKCSFSHMGGYARADTILWWSTGPHWYPTPQT